MSFLHPSLLWLLLGVGALAAGYLRLQRRRRHYAVRFTNVELLESVAPKRPGWRRHVPVAGVLLGLIAAVIGLARPAHATEVPRESAIVMLAIDVSGSMASEDVAPNRLEAAIAAAAAFVDDLPDGFQVGLVAFDRTAHVLVTPTQDHASVVTAISTLQLGQGTAAGDGIVAALDAIAAAQAAAGVIETATTDEGTPATIVLLSDGATTAGISAADAATLAADAGVPVSTITFGTETGTVTLEGEVVAVPPDATTMTTVAGTTGGTAFDAATSSELNDVYDEIQGRVGYVTERSDLTVWFLGAALVCVVLAMIGSLVWTGRFL